MSARPGQLIRLLASDRDGECLAAARALGRILEANGRDWHWLGDLADLHLAVAPADASGPHWQRRALHLLNLAADNLKPAERHFLEQMAHWRSPSEKQLDWLDAIEAAMTARWAS